MTWQTVEGTVIQGHQVASGRAKNSPYGAGTIRLQTPYFQALGLDISSYYPGTINLSIAPYCFQVLQAYWQVDQLSWTPLHPPETFSFFQAQLEVSGLLYAGLVYYPHPETKQTHFQGTSVLELLAPKIPGLTYGDRLTLGIKPDQLAIVGD